MLLVSLPKCYVAKTIKAGITMIQTIILGSCVSVQGVYVKTLPDGKITVRVGQKLYTGWPVTPAQAA